MDPTIGKFLTEILPFVAMSLSLLIPVIAIVCYFVFRDRRDKRWHETARLAIEKGVPLPSHPLGAEPRNPPLPIGATGEPWSGEQRARKRESELKGGLVLIGLGTALYLTKSGMAFPGLVLLGIGAALLLGYFLIRSDHDHRGPPPA